MTAALFRPGAIAHQGQRLEGAVILSQPLPMRLFVSLLVVLTAAAVILLATNSYQRKVAVPGTLLPVAGLIELSVPQNGVISELLVEADQRVMAGQPLLVVSSEHVLESGENAEQELLISLQQQGQGLLDKLTMAKDQAKLFERDYKQRLQLSEQQIHQMESAEVRQQMLLELRLRQNQRGEQLRNQGLLAVADQESLQAQWLSQMQVAADAQSQLQNARAARNNLQQEEARQRLRNEQEQRDLQAQLQQVRQQQLQVRRETRRVITAPVAGRISMLQAKAGMSVKPQ